MPSLLEARTLSFGYSGHAPVLDAVSLALRRGEVCALLGPNGAGKTTFLRLLLGLLRPTGGEVLLEGVPLHSLTGRKRAKRMAYVPQEALPRFSMTVFDAVLLGRKPHMRWGPDKNDIARTGETLARLGLESLAQRPLEALSGGQRQKTALARALVQDTDWLLLDEPVSSLDLRHQIEVLDMARRVAETHNLGVLLSLHDVNLAIRFAHTIALLAPSPQGARLKAHGDPAAVLTPGRMRAVYGIAMQAYHGEDGQVPLWFPSSTQS